MAIKPIIRYGEFTPTGVDRSAETRMRALAGLGEQAMKLAVGAAEREKTEREAEEKEQAVLQAPEVGYAEGEQALATGVYTPSLGHGAQKRQVAARAGYLASFENTMQQTINDAVAQSNGDYQEFSNIANGALDGMMQAYTNLPEEWKDKAYKQVARNIELAGAPILKAQNKFNFEKNETEFLQAENTRSNTEINLAFNGNYEALSDARSTNLEAINTAMQGGITSEKIKSDKPAHLAALRLQISRGEFHRGVIETEQEIETPEDIIKRVQIGEQFIESLRDKKTLYVIDPNDSTKKVAVSQDEKETIIEQLENDLKDFSESETKKAERKQASDRLSQINAYNGYQTTVLDSEISDEQKLVDITKGEMDGTFDRDGARKLRAYVNSSKALNAVTNPEKYGTLISQLYDLNANLDLDENGEAYLTGLNNINDQVIEMRTNGQLSQSDENKFRSQMDNLTNAKKAKATVAIRESWYKADKILTESLPPELTGEGTRLLFEEVQAEKARLESEGMTIVANDEMKLWEQLAPKVANDLLQRRRTEVMQQIQNEIVPPVTPATELPQVSTQGDYNDLRSGTLYFNVVKGIRERKP
jgi:hypothetical protein